MESLLKNMVLTLFVITLVASSAVGVVYSLTKDTIEESKQAKKMLAIEMVAPEFDNNLAETEQIIEQDGKPYTIYTAKKGEEVSGYVVEALGNGFGGEIKMMIGFMQDGTINKIEVVSHTETPGLGDKIETKKSDFSSKFSGKNPGTFKLKVKKDGGDVDAITAATITSRAFTASVEKAYNAVNQINK